MSPLSPILLICLLGGVLTVPTGKDPGASAKQKENAKKAFVRDGEQSEQDLEEVHSSLAEIRESCSKDLAELAKQQEQDEKFKAMVKQEETVRKEHGSKVRKEGKKMSKLNAALSEYLYQYDIILTPEQAKQVANETKSKSASEQSAHGVQKRQAQNPNYYTASKWLDGVVYYTFDGTVSVTLKTLILKAMQLWSSKTCLVFTESTTATNKLIFSTVGGVEGDSGCWSYVGRISSRSTQTVNIGTNCDQIGIIAHEVGHALGFWHGQSRHDRNTWVYYAAANVIDGAEDNFNMESTTTNQNYNQLYDYGSIMHYSARAFSADETSPTLYTKRDYPSSEWLQTIGQSMGPSFTDLRVMNSHYSCASVCTSQPITCYNGGYQNPKNCAECVCPPGIGGTTCGLVMPTPIRYGYAPPGVPNTCPGTNHYVGPTWTELTGSIGTYDMSLQDQSDYAWCHWFLYTDTTNRIVIEVLEVGDYCSDGCFYGNLEVRLWENADWSKTGRRYCCDEDLWSQGTGTGTLTFTTPDPGYRAMISLYASLYKQRFRIRYKSIPKV